MTRTLLITAAALSLATLSLAACATAPEPLGPPTSEVRAPVGTPSLEGWNIAHRF